jgi:hypothetical protein
VQCAAFTQAARIGHSRTVHGTSAHAEEVLHEHRAVHRAIHCAHTLCARTCSVSALVYLVTRKLVRLTKYAMQLLISSDHMKPGRVWMRLCTCTAQTWR